MKLTPIPISSITPVQEVRKPVNGAERDLPRPDDNDPDQKDLDQLNDDGCPNNPPE